MTLTAESAESAEYLIDTFGNEVDMWNPEFIYNEEGDKKLDMGNKRTIMMLMFDASQEEAIMKMEGIDLIHTYRAYAIADEEGNIESSTIFKHGDDYYKIKALARVTFQNTVAYVSMIITKTGINTV